ncbi:hypothetical protein GCM10009579_66220 [Streptomyces javensis]|uniref:Uncharacterized protein n=1 Tax=Streptomyces javensis TaxID=114698 RepID=A0ABP4HW00_9ACTN
MTAFGRLDLAVNNVGVPSSGQAPDSPRDHLTNRPNQLHAKTLAPDSRRDRARSFLLRGARLDTGYVSGMAL